MQARRWADDERDGVRGGDWESTQRLAGRMDRPANHVDLAGPGDGSGNDTESSHAGTSYVFITSGSRGAVC